MTFAGASGQGTASPEGKVSVWQALKKASEGEVVTITVETCGCPGGLVSLGPGQMPPQGREKLVDLHTLDHGVGGEHGQEEERVERQIDELARVEAV